MKTIRQAVYDIFMIRGADYKEMTIDEITLEIVCTDLEYKDFNADELKKKVAAVLSNEVTKIVKGRRVEDKSSIYERVKNGKGGYKKGVYKLRKPKVSKPKIHQPVVKPIAEAEPIKNLFLGSAGEMAVCSELLFREFNVSRMAVDDGIDIVAMKNNKTFYIQVKTISVTKKDFSVNIGTSSYNKYSSNDCYYIFVARAEKTKFIVATADDISRMISHGSSKTEKQISIRFIQEDGKVFVNGEDVQYMIDSFDRIK